MKPVRTVARALLGAAFIRSGLEAYSNPDRLVDGAKPVTDRLAPAFEAVGMPADARTIVRLNGAVQLAAGVLLATNTAVRPAAVALAGTLVPTTVAELDITSTEDPVRRSVQRNQFLKNLGLFGGLLLAAVDTEGRPGLAWRAGHLADHAQDSVKRAARMGRRETKRAAHLTAKEAKRAAHLSAKEAKRAAESTRRTARTAARETRLAVKAAGAGRLLPG
jgi:putative oxidoreductase